MQVLPLFMDYQNLKKFSENEKFLDPLSFYSATKQSIEQISKYYSNLYKIPSIGLRFFTCYGPWGRPDLSVTKITEGILKKKLHYLIMVELKEIILI